MTQGSLRDAADNSPRYRVVLSERAIEAVRSITSKADLAAVMHAIDLLDTVPWIGRAYDPVYEAARPSVNVLVVYAGHFGIYYRIDETEASVQVLFVEDQRRDPLRRFS